MSHQQTSSVAKNMNLNALCYQYLSILYKDMRGHGVNNRQNKNISETYGEILYPSVDLLFSKCHLRENDVFYDLGSGLGKVVIQVFLKTRVKEAVGIEIIPELHQKSLQAAQQVQQDLPHFYLGDRQLSFLLGNFLEIPLMNATVLLLGSPCFSPDMLSKMSEIIDNTSNIHTVLTLRPLTTLKRLAFKSMVRVEGSWDTALCYVYQSK